MLKGNISKIAQGSGLGQPAALKQNLVMVI